MPLQKGKALSAKDRNYSLQGAVVLVVDDDLDVLVATRDLLTSWKCAVLTAASVNEALSVITDEDIDVVVADYDLGDEHTGLDLINTLNEHSSKPCKALIISGNVSNEQMRQLREGPYPILSKPVLPMTLRSSLHQLLKA